jgi:glycosyltransferase involved in cell wall biosynthesis
MSAVSAPVRTLRICVVAERMSAPLDEGGRKFADHLASALEHRAEVMTVSVGGDAAANERGVTVPGSRTFTGGGLRSVLRDFRPDVICYAPAASMTASSAARARALKLHCPGARLVLAAMQPRRHSAVSRTVFRMLRPDIVLALSQKTAEEAAGLARKIAVLPPAVDLDRFRPAGTEERAGLRRKFAIGQGEFIILHVGHAKRERGIEVLGNLPSGVLPLLVTARSEGTEDDLLESLRSRGVRVITDFISDINEVYQAADCYVFPVFEPDASIDAPLSVFEAMACNLPVLAAPFGALPELFEEGPGFRFVHSPGDILMALEHRDWMSGPGTRVMAEPYSWDNAAARFISIIEESS